MFERLRSWRIRDEKKPMVLSLGALAETVGVRREQGQFEVLVRHLLGRFVHNDVLAAEGEETKKVMLAAYAAALPTLIVSLFLMPLYHRPDPRSDWAQYADHLFFVTYAFVAMGVATVYEWDLLFPDLLDVYVLNVLPVETRRLFAARVVALAIFLGLVLVGTSALGVLFFPVFTELSHFWRRSFAHALAVGMSGAFAGALFLALQGVLLQFAGERMFRRLAPLLQGGSILVLLTVMFLFPAVSSSLRGLMGSGSEAVKWFPPFWFLGVYEHMIGGASDGMFGELARRGWIALALAMLVVVVTYPAAYRKRVRQLIEGSVAAKKRRMELRGLSRLLHGLVVRDPRARAVFHFAGQTVLRWQKQRVMLAMFGGLAAAIVVSGMVTFRVGGSGVHVVLMDAGMRAVAVEVAFFVVAALRVAMVNPVDLRGSWVFRAVSGRPVVEHIGGARQWVMVWAVGWSVGAALLICAMDGKGWMVLPELVVAVGAAIVLTEAFLLGMRRIPFTYARVSGPVDLPITVLRYFVALPVLIEIGVGLGRWMELSAWHVVKALMWLAVAWLVLCAGQRVWMRQLVMDGSVEDEETFPQGLGLRDS